jgi:hypothetical protein
MIFEDFAPIKWEVKLDCLRLFTRFWFVFTFWKS